MILFVTPSGAVWCRQCVLGLAWRRRSGDGLLATASGRLLRQKFPSGPCSGGKGEYYIFSPAVVGLNHPTTTTEWATGRPEGSADTDIVGEQGTRRGLVAQGTLEGEGARKAPLEPP